MPEQVWMRLIDEAPLMGLLVWAVAYCVVKGVPPLVKHLGELCGVGVTFFKVATATQTKMLNLQEQLLTVQKQLLTKIERVAHFFEDVTAHEHDNGMQRAAHTKHYPTKRRATDIEEEH